MEGRGPVLARRLLVAIGALLAIAGLYILANPVDPNDFEGATGVAWTAFEAANPEPAAYLEREARLLAVSTVFLGLLAAALAGTAPKTGNRSAWIIKWFLPLALAGFAAVFLTAGGGALGSMYAVAAVVTAIATWVAARPASNPA